MGTTSTGFLWPHAGHIYPSMRETKPEAEFQGVCVQSKAVSYAAPFRASDLYFAISGMKAPAYAVRICEI